LVGGGTGAHGPDVAVGLVFCAPDGGAGSVGLEEGGAEVVGEDVTERVAGEGVNGGLVAEPGIDVLHGRYGVHDRGLAPHVDGVVFGDGQ